MRSTEASIPGPALFSILIYDLEQVAEPTLCCLPLWDPNRQGALRGPQCHCHLASSQALGPASQFFHLLALLP